MRTTTHINHALSLVSQRRPRRGPVLRRIPEHVRPLLRPVFSDLPEQKPAFVCQSINDVFYAVAEGLAESVMHWLDNRVCHFREYDEAALDLALKKNHIKIAELFVDEIKYNDTIEKATRQATPIKSDLYNRIIIKGGNERYFNEFLFETFVTGKACITLLYTPLAKPFLEPIIQYSSNHFDDRMYFTFYLEDESITDIYTRMYRILETLSSISGSQFDRVYSALDEFFVDAGMGFPGGNYFSRQEELNDEPRLAATYVDYQLYRAAWELDYQLMRDLLRHGANPNATFDEESILYYVAMHGTGKVVSPLEIDRCTEHYQAALDIVELLLQYGADPAVKKHGKTLTDRMVYYEHSVIKEEIRKKLYRDIIKRLSAASVEVVPTPVHPSLAKLPISQVILTSNEIMEKRKTRKSYIRNIVGYSTPTATIMNLYMVTGRRVRVESKKLTHLSETEQKEIYAFFLSKFVLPESVDKKKYWDLVLIPNDGEIYVDIVRQQDQVIGLVLSEVMDAELDSHPTVYYSKFTIGRFSEYPGLMKLIMLARNFATPESEKLSYSFYEATSGGGYAICGDIKQFPANIAAGEVMPNLVKRVYGEDEEILIENGVWYLKDPIIAAEDEIEEDVFKNPSILMRKAFKRDYQKPGYTLLMCFENNRENRLALIASLAPLMGEENVSKIFDLYSQNPKVALNMLQAKL